MPQPKYPRPRRPRPVNPQDNPLTTGLPYNPNGTYVANPYPTTAAAGSQGGYGSGLPTTQFGTPLSTAGQYNTGQTFLGSVKDAYNRIVQQNYSSPYSVSNVGYAPYGVTPYVPKVNIPAPSITQPTQTPNPMQNVPSYGAPAASRDPYAGITPESYLIEQRGRGYDLFRRIEEHPEEFDALPPAQQEAIKNVLSGGSSVTGGETTGNSDFMNTKFMQQNAANNVAFTQQLRWDPERKKYVQIGTLLKEGKLDLQGRTKKVKRRGGGGGNASPEAKQTTGGFTGSYGVVNFSTSTG